MDPAALREATLRKAREMGLPYDALGNLNLAILRDDMQALNVLPPARWVRATADTMPWVTV